MAILSFSLTDESFAMNMVLSYKATAEKVTLSFDRKAVLPTPPKIFRPDPQRSSAAGKTFRLVCTKI